MNVLTLLRRLLLRDSAIEHGLGKVDANYRLEQIGKLEREMSGATGDVDSEAPARRMLQDHLAEEGRFPP
jgi:hypothetical protein